MSSRDEKCMQMALRLAQRGTGSVEPNPAVGCVITKANQVIGRGWHRKFGGPHAEINAFQDCKKHGVEPRGATMYVTLEPCCHKGQTGPCTDAIISTGIKKVVVATIDPSKHAGGKGIVQLKDAGVEVEVGVCEQQAKLLNAPFLKHARTDRCWVIVKWAQSIDGKLAYKDTTQRWLSPENSRKDAHKLRRRAGAILVGINTVLADDPLLTARPGRGKKALRVVLDNNLRIPLDCQLLQTAKKTPVLLYVSKNSVRANSEKCEQIVKKGAEVLAYPDTQAQSNLYFLLEQLSRRGISQLLVEGGPTAINSFLKEGLADELVVYIAPKILGSKGGADIGGSTAEIGCLNYVEIKRFDDDVCIRGLTKKV